MYPKTYSVLYNLYNNVLIAVKINRDVYGELNSEYIDNNYIKVAIIFDSGYESVYYNALPILKKYNIKANVGLIPSLINEKEYMNYFQISNLYIDGWDVLNQTYSHKQNMYDYSEKLLEDIKRAQRWMDDNFLNRTSNDVIIPYGEINPYLLKLLYENNFNSVRTSDNILTLNKSNIQYYQVKSIHMSANVEIVDVKKLLQESFEAKTTTILIFNKISENQDNSKMNFNKSAFSEIVEFLYDNSHKYKVVTYSNLF